MAYKPLATYLRTYRLRAGLSHDELAFLLGSIYGANVGKHERGSRLPMLRNAIAYEIILGVPIRLLYEGIFLEVREQVHRRLQALLKHLQKSERGADKQKAEMLRVLLEQHMESFTPRE